MWTINTKCGIQKEIQLERLPFDGAKSGQYVIDALPWFYNSIIFQTRQTRVYAHCFSKTEDKRNERHHNTWNIMRMMLGCLRNTWMWNFNDFIAVFYALLTLIALVYLSVPNPFIFHMHWLNGCGLCSFIHSQFFTHSVPFFLFFCYCTIFYSFFVFQRFAAIVCSMCSTMHYALYNNVVSFRDVMIANLSFVAPFVHQTKDVSWIEWDKDINRICAPKLHFQLTNFAIMTGQTKQKSNIESAFLDIQC